jgi:hypothetical protein
MGGGPGAAFGDSRSLVISPVTGSPLTTETCLTISESPGIVVQGEESSSDGHFGMGRSSKASPRTIDAIYQSGMTKY